MIEGHPDETIVMTLAQWNALQQELTACHAWMRKAGHLRKCSVRAPHAATMDYKPKCNCGYAEHVEGHEHG